MKTAPKNITRQKSRAFGVRAETLSALLLMCKGYRILERNYLHGGGEIDLIVQRGRVIAFVEVKARPTQGAALIAIDDRKLERIAKAARSWVNRAHEPQNLDLRFDAVLIAPRTFPRHMPNIAPLPNVY
jgi:putative endonuclease